MGRRAGFEGDAGGVDPGAGFSLGFFRREVWVGLGHRRGEGWFFGLGGRLGQAGGEEGFDAGEGEGWAVEQEEGFLGANGGEDGAETLMGLLDGDAFVVGQEVGVAGEEEVGAGEGAVPGVGESVVGGAASGVAVWRIEGDVADRA